MKFQRALVVAVCVSVLGFISYIAVKAGIADSLVYGANHEINTWVASGAPPGNSTLDWVANDLLRAVRIDSGNPNSHELLGVVTQLRGGSPEFLRNAAIHFTSALELRPTSPYGWANVAAIEYRLGTTGAAFDRALLHAAQLGPSEPEVQRTVVDYGFAAWDQLQPDTKKAIQTVVANGMRRAPKEMLHIAERRGRLAIACRLLPADPRTLDLKWSQLCQSTEAKS